MTKTRNALGPAYGAADALYENAVALTLFLDAWSKQGVTPRLNESAAQHLRHNLINAQSNLNALRQTLADALDAVPDACPVCGLRAQPHWDGRTCNACGYGYPLVHPGDQTWPANADCDDGPVRGSCATPAESAPGGLSGSSGRAGDST